MRKIFLLLLCLVSVFTLAGCGDKEISSASIVRDDARTGGSYSFVYDKKERLITIGGEGEVIQYSSANLAEGVDAGCRIGLKVTAPDEVSDLEDATLEMNGVNYSSGDFLEEINGQKQRFFVIQPLVSEEDKEIGFSVKWQNGTKKQQYKIVIAPGTKFMGGTETN